MEPEPVGRVLTEAKIENLKDLWAVEQGLRRPDQARSATIADALVSDNCPLSTWTSWSTCAVGRLSATPLTAGNMFMNCIEFVWANQFRARPSVPVALGDSDWTATWGIASEG